MSIFREIPQISNTVTDGIRCIVTDRRVKAGIAGQRAVTVNVRYVGPTWDSESDRTFIHSLYGGPVYAILFGQQYRVEDAGRHGDTAVLGDAWFASFYAGAVSTGPVSTTRMDDYGYPLATV